jgi:N-methylhydantoinase A
MTGARTAVSRDECFRIGVDIGGTFTDCVVIDARGRRSVSKALTTHESLTDGVLDALAVNAGQLSLSRRELLEATSMFVHGTTVGTNAVLTRTGARTGLITTRGHEDALTIGKVFAKRAGLSEREILHSSRLHKPHPIVPRELVRGVTERIDRDGDVVVALDEDGAIDAIESLLALEVEAIAVSMLWSFVNDAHERRVGELIAERAEGQFVTLSHELAPLLGEYERTATTAMNAYVGPKVSGYLWRLEHALRQEGLRHPLLVMQTGGGLTSVDDAVARPILTLDSGPVGGILGARHIGELYGERNVICSDVGGTSFEVGVILDAEVPLDPEPVVSQYTLRIPKIAVRSIGAGGGTIAWLDDSGLLRVGPQSAGSDPGPACYGLGGMRATVTDADLALGYLDPDRFLDGRMRLSTELASEALGALGSQLGLEPEQIALGIFRIINAQMADLMHKSTIEKGYDPRDCVLLAYGGAGPTHAAFYGDDIGAKAILIPPTSTAFSAEGLLTCDITHTEQLSRTVVGPFGRSEIAELAQAYRVLEDRVLGRFGAEGVEPADVSLRRSIGSRFALQVHSVDVDVEAGDLSAGAVARVQDRFIQRYVQLYGDGALPHAQVVEFDQMRVTGTRVLERPPEPVAERGGGDLARAVLGERSAYFEPDGFLMAVVYDGRELCPGDRVEGPAIIQRMGDSVVVPVAAEARIDEHLVLRLTRIAEAAASPPSGIAMVAR